MYSELYQYLLHYKILPVPGIGTFLLERQPAQGDLPNRVIQAPSHIVSFRAELLPFPRHFFSWLGQVMGLQDREASARFGEFAAQAREQVNTGHVIHWKGVGTIDRLTNGELRFSPETVITETPVPAVKVLRENAEHLVRVGEDERTSVEMTRILSISPARRSFDWFWPAVLVFLAVLFIGWYLSDNGVNTGSTGNIQKIPVTEQGKSYELVQ